MKILHAIACLRRAAGTTAFCVHMAEACAKAGHAVAIAVMGPNSEHDDVPEGVSVVTWQPGTELSLRPDIIHVHGLWTPWLHRAQAWAHKEEIPVVLSPHGMLAPWAMAHKRWKKIVPWLLYQRGDVQKATLIHTTAAQETQWVRDLGFRNPTAEVPLGTALPAEPATHDGPIRALLFVGRIYPVKGLDLLLKAWALAKSRVPGWDWHLLLVGPDQTGHMAELETLAASLGLKTRRGPADGVGEVDVTFTGPLYGSEKDAAYRMSRGLILPSYTENFGGVVIDALAFGLPVLTSAATPWKHLEAEGCGRTFALVPEPLAETLKAFAGVPDAARQVAGLKGRALVERDYTWQAVGRKMAEAYRTVL